MITPDGYYKDFKNKKKGYSFEHPFLHHPYGGLQRSTAGGM